MNSLLKLIRSQGLITLLALFGFGLTASMSGLGALAITYDEHAEPAIAYDAPSLSAFDYDSASALAGNEKETPKSGDCNLFAQNAKFLAAEGGLYSSLRGEPMDSALLDRIKTAFEGKSPGHIFGDNAWGEMHLGPDLGITGETLNERVIALRMNPSTSSVYEELIHTAQIRRGMTDVTQMEIEAAQKLIRFADRYHIPPSETAATIERLNALQGLK